jgi:hypothetical protein
VGGRKNDLIATRTGRLLHPLRFDFVFGFSLANAVRRYKIHQRADGSVTVGIEACEPIAPREISRIEQEIRDLLEGYPVSAEIVDALPGGALKHRWTTSDLVTEQALQQTTSQVTLVS